jgi:hypothetical protein
MLALFRFQDGNRISILWHGSRRSILGMVEPCRAALQIHAT